MIVTGTWISNNYPKTQNFGAFLKFLGLNVYFIYMYIVIDTELHILYTGTRLAVDECCIVLWNFQWHVLCSWLCDVSSITSISLSHLQIGGSPWLIHDQQKMLFLVFEFCVIQKWFDRQLYKNNHSHFPWYVICCARYVSSWCIYTIETFLQSGVSPTLQLKHGTRGKIFVGKITIHCIQTVIQVVVRLSKLDCLYVHRI